MRIRNSALISLTLIFFLLSYHAWSDPSKKDKKQKNDPELQQKKQAAAIATLIDAKRYDIVGNPDKAIELYRQVIDKFPDVAVTYFELGRLLEEKGEFAEAIKCGEKAVELDPENDWYQLFLAEVYQLTAQFDGALDIYKKLTAKSPNNLDYLYQLATLYITKEKFNDAINVYNKIEIKVGINQEISMQKKGLYLHMKQTEKAEKEVVNLVNSDPENTKYLAILAEFYMTNSMQDKALEVYQQIAKIDPNDPFIHMSLADFYKKNGEGEKAYEELKLGFANPSMNAEDKIKIMLFFYSIDQLYGDQKAQALELTQILITTHPNAPQPYSLMGDLLMEDKQPEKAREAFIKSAELDNTRYIVWQQILQLDIQLSKFDDLITRGQAVIELFPDQPIPYLFTGMGYAQLKNPEKAVTILTRGSKLVVSNNYLLAQFYMYLGDSYHSLNKSLESDMMYDKSLALVDSNAYVLNNYSYYLSLRGEKLSKAESMAKLAVTLEPDNPSFQDTYGWVLFKVGKYAEAQEWVLKAIQSKEAPSGEVLEHYGDILFKLGDTKQAVEYWQKAKDKGDASPNIDLKIREKKLYE